MTTIIEKAKYMGALAIRVLGKRRERDQAGGWVQSEASIKNLHAQISEPLDFLKWIAGKGTEFGPSSPSGLARAKNTIEKYLSYLSDNPNADKSHEQISNLSVPIRNLIESQRNSARTLWEQYVATIKWENVDIYAAFKNDDTHGKSVQELAEATRAYQGLVSEYFLRRKEQRVEFDELLETHAQLIRTLPAMNDAEVRTFLVDAASAVGAPLGNLTENVLTWLKDHKLTAKYSARRRES